MSVGTSHAVDPRAAVAEAARTIELDRACFVQAMVPDRFDLEALAAALNDTMTGTTVFGCTTAGQITPAGYDDDALMLVAFPRAYFRCATKLVSPLAPVDMKAVASEARRTARQFSRTAGRERIGLVLADGTSKQEDMFVAALAAGLDDLPVFGGSAGHGGSGEGTYIFHDGRFHANAALLVLIETALNVSGLGFHHFEPTNGQMVVTAAVPEERLVLELNGAPAASEYARLVGCEVGDLSPDVFARNPVLVRADKSYHVRAIRAVEGNGALSFLSAIDDGLILTLGRGKEVVRTLEAGLAPSGSPPEFVLGFDCYLRKLELRQAGLLDVVSETLARHRVLGFSTFGEQHRGVHVNQTFVGIAFRQPTASVEP